MLMQEMIREVPWPVWGAVTTFFLTATAGIPCRELLGRR
jgi:hypothetical protein